MKLAYLIEWPFNFRQADGTVPGSESNWRVWFAELGEIFELA